MVIILTIKQLKRRVVQGLIEPELFYMPVKQLNNINTLFFRMYYHQVHWNTYELSYHGWSKNHSLYIDRTNAYIKDYNIFLSDKKIGKWESLHEVSEGGYNYYNRLTMETEIHKDEIKYYGMLFRCTSKHTTYPRYCHTNNLLTCLNTARPHIEVRLNNKQTLSFSLLRQYDEYISNTIGDCIYGEVNWYVFYDSIENSIKSSLLITKENSTTSVLETVLIEDYL